MKIELAKYSGFCMGVKNALLKIIDEINSSNEELSVYGPLIHNPQTLKVLNKRGLNTINNLNQSEGKRVSIRTHGMPIDEYRKLKSKASSIINLTCKKVSMVQSIIKKYSKKGYSILIIGDKKHSEVIGLKSYASKGVNVISKISDIVNIPNDKKYLLVSQTTLDRNFFNNVVGDLKKKNYDITVIDTICDSTRLRQEEVNIAIKNGIDTLIVVGGKISSNTKRLAEIGIRNNIQTIHIETSEEIIERNLLHSNYIFITAGASTPGWLINNVLEKIYDIKLKNSNFLINILFKIITILTRTNFLSVITAFFLNLFTQKYAGMIPDYRYAFLSSAFLFSMYSFNNYFDREFLKSSNPSRYLIYQKFGLLLLGLSIAAMMVSLWISLNINLQTFAILLLVYIPGFLYSTEPIKKIILKLNNSQIRKIYNSKLIEIIGWLIILIPFLNNNIEIHNLLAILIFIIIYFYLRHLLLVLIAYQGDLIFGRETLPVWFGIKKIYLFSIIFSTISIICYTLSVYFYNDPLFIIFNINLIFFVILMSRIVKQNYIISIKYELIVDLNYLIFILLYFVV